MNFRTRKNDSDDDVADTMDECSKDDGDEAGLTDPMVNHPLVGSEGLDIGGYAGGGGPLDTPLVDRVLAYWGNIGKPQHWTR